MILRLTVAVAAALMLNLPSLADTSVALEKSVSTPLVQVLSATRSEEVRGAPDFGSGMSDMHGAVPLSESLPLIGQAQPAPPEVIAQPLEAPPAKQHKDLWERIRAGFALPDMNGQLVARHERWYLHRPQYIQRMIERSSLYLYFIVEELQKRNMPTEIALLPMIESAYNPQAYSRMRAAGIWQFIPSTGRQYGLQQGAWYDGRRDVLSATRAALDYLQFLHDMFGDWQLALAAYNWGEGSVQRAVAKNRAHHKRIAYANLNMPNETRNYLPKLQAIKNIISNPTMFGFEISAVPNQPYFAVLRPPGHIDVAKAAQLAEMPVAEFRALNAGYQGPLMIQGAARHIVLPIDKVDEFYVNLENNNDPLVTWEPYTMKPGETLQKLAGKFTTTVSRLRNVNRFHRRNHIRPGEIVLVPLANEDGTTELHQLSKGPEFHALSAKHPAGRAHRVRSAVGYSALPSRITLPSARKRLTPARASGYTKQQLLAIYGRDALR
jgi:membrane-bound lytic murein transglycosylase D